MHLQDKKDFFKRLLKGVTLSSSAQKAPLLGGLEPRSWRSMGSSGLMPKRNQSTKIKVRGQVVCFTVRSFNTLLGTLVVDPEIYFIFLKKPPAKHKARDNSWRGLMFGMFELRLKIGGGPMTTEEISALEERYLLTDSAMMMCKMGPVFEELLDDDEPTVLADTIYNDDEEEYDATTRAMLVDNIEGYDDDDQEYNPDEVDFA
ncbi:hypothetical protein HAX54_037137 [Datura stramonium]|uniref:Uncharacterized protein n=1 Tax=Datura stramonium TaxID=4076 RepID=A0ABS8SGQ8_DATST|nr:hypothetical protein [Datura stramonium]